MTVAQDIIQDALEMLGVYAPGEVISAADENRALTVFNDMLDNWSNLSLVTYARSEQSAVFTPGKYQYTIGPGGDINLPRPIRILDGAGCAYLIDASQTVYGMDVITQEEWNQITTRAFNTSQLPDTLFYDPQFPLGVINIFPTPTVAYTFYFDSLLPFTDAASLASTVSLPPGYNLAMKANLAMELLPYFPQTDQIVVQRVIEKASRSLGDIKRTNAKTPAAQFDASIVKKGGKYNIYTSDYGR